MSELQKYDAPFYISSTTWKEVTDKVAMDNAPLMENILNEHLALSGYGSGVKHLTVIFIVVKPINTIHEEVVRYNRKKHEIYIQKKLPYTLVTECKKHQVLQLMAVTYLEVLADLQEKQIPDFDLPRLQQDVQELFEARDWLQKERTTS